MEPSSRASSIGSDAQAKASTSLALDTGPTSSQTATGRDLNGRKRKADGEDAPGAELSVLPRQRKQKVAYAAYIDSRTGGRFCIRRHSHQAQFLQTHHCCIKPVFILLAACLCKLQACRILWCTSRFCKLLLSSSL